MDTADIFHANGGILVTLSGWLTNTPIVERSTTTDLFRDRAMQVTINNLSTYLLDGEERVNVAPTKVVIAALTRETTGQHILFTLLLHFPLMQRLRNSQLARRAILLMAGIAAGQTITLLTAFWRARALWPRIFRFPWSLCQAGATATLMAVIPGMSEALSRLLYALGFGATLYRRLF